MKITKNKVVEKIFNSQEYEELLIKLVEREHLYKDDFKQELMIILLEMDDDFIINLWTNGRMKFFVTRLILNQIYSSSSPFYKKYRKENKEMIEADDSTDDEYSLIDSIPHQEDDNYMDEVINGDILSYVNKNGILTWYETNFLSEYYKLGVHGDNPNKVSYRSLEEDYGIHYTSIHKTVKDAVAKIKNHMEEQGHIDIQKQMY